MEEQIKKEATPRKKEKKPHAPITPIREPALPMLLAVVVFTVCLVALVINKFIYPFENELLSPIILQVIALVIPAYLVIMLAAEGNGMLTQMKEIGFRALRAEYVFFILFSSLFASCLSLILTLTLGGAYGASAGVTLLGSFTAGESEHSASIIYIILAYAVIPALAEEFLFRGVMLSRLERVSFPFAALVSTLISALSGFMLGGLIPSIFVSLIAIFVLYTTRSLWACVILHFIFNIYRLFVESNVSAYFLSSVNTPLLIITVLLALSVSALLFFSESARIFRKRAHAVASREATSEERLSGIKSILEDIRSTITFKPTLIFSIIVLCEFVAIAVINYIV